MIGRPVITAYGGAMSVTGANFMFEVPEKKILIDCGMLQGQEGSSDFNYGPFNFDVGAVDFLCITHAHLDHIGRIPKLIHDGFKGRILSTHATKDIAMLMLQDTNHIVSGKEKAKERGMDKVYTQENLDKAMSLWDSFDYHARQNLGSNLAVEAFDAGHVLGSCQFAFYYGGKTIVFTGDLGNSPSPLLRDAEIVPGADFMLMESVYGDRNHEHREERSNQLKKIIMDNFKRKGVLVVPIFSLERSQEFLYELNEMVEGGEIPKMPVFLDSPLAIRVTKIYDRYPHLFNDEVQKDIAGGDDIFDFPGLEETLKTRDSKSIMRQPSPKIILAGSGMSAGGRVMHHEKLYLADAKNTLMLTGYQAPGTLGRELMDGAKTITINDMDIPVRAHVEGIYGYSGHKDSDNLVKFVGENKDSLKRVFIGMGELGPSTHLAQRIKDEYGIEAKVLEMEEPVEIDLFE
jgi:metallo-beta-lactamase family protein